MLAFDWFPSCHRAPHRCSLCVPWLFVIQRHTKAFKTISRSPSRLQSFMQSGGLVQIYNNPYMVFKIYIYIYILILYVSVFIWKPWRREMWLLTCKITVVASPLVCKHLHTKGGLSCGPINSTSLFSFLFFFLPLLSEGQPYPFTSGGVGPMIWDMLASCQMKGDKSRKWKQIEPGRPNSN